MEGKIEKKEKIIENMIKWAKNHLGDDNYLDVEKLTASKGDHPKYLGQ